MYVPYLSFPCGADRFPLLRSPTERGGAEPRRTRLVARADCVSLWRQQALLVPSSLLLLHNSPPSNSPALRKTRSLRANSLRRDIICCSLVRM